jgi:hypothetical protein
MPDSKKESLSPPYMPSRFDEIHLQFSNALLSSSQYICSWIVNYVYVQINYVYVEINYVYVEIV